MGTDGDGSGHVAIVEKINTDGTIVTSNSAWGGTRFYLKTLSPPNYNMGAAYTFQGFIYNPAVSGEVGTVDATYVVGRSYTLQANMKVRTGAGTRYRWKRRSELTADGRKNSQNTAYAVLRKGTKVTCQAVVRSGSYVWLKIPSGYVCAGQGNIIYIK